MQFYLKKCINICFVFIFSIVSYGQIGNWQFKKFDIEDGLPNNANITIIQDSLEFIWIGSENGLSRYNGIYFQNYFNKIGDSTSLPGNKVNKLFIDSKNRLFIGTSDGLCYYNVEYDNFTWISAIGRVSVQDLIEDKQGIYWVATEGNGLFKLSINFQLIKQYNDKTMGHFIWRLYDEDEQLWIGTLDGRLLSLNKKLEIFSQIKEFGINNGFISAIEKDSENNLLILSDNSGLSKIIRSKKITDSITRIINYNNLNYRFMKMIKRSNNVFWLSSFSGIVAFNSRENFFYQLQDDPKYTGLDVNFWVWSVFIDKQQNIWIGGNGLYLITNSNKKFNYYLYEQFKSLEVSEITKSNTDQLIIGTNMYGIFVKDSSKNFFYKCTKFNLFTKLTVNVSHIYRITQNNENEYFVGTYRGFFVCNTLQNKIEYYHAKDKHKNSINNNQINDILKIDKETYWLATNGGGINIYNSKTKEFEYIVKRDEDRNDMNQLCNNYCISLLKDHTGKIWIGTYNGLSIYDPSNGQFRNYLHNEKDSTSLSHDWVYYIYEDSENKIWIGTPNGLNLYLPKTNNFKIFTKKNGLVDNMINGIIEDNKKQLWLSTGKGISKISLNDYSCKSYNNDDGLKILYYARGSIYKDHNGYIYMGGKNGLVSFHPDSIGFNPNYPNIRITAIKIFNKEINSKSEPNILPKEVICLNKIEIPYDNNVISIEFTAFNYINTNKNKYAYTLEGFDQNWQYIDYKKDVTYTNLNPGEYTFKVKASNNDGIWNEIGVSLKIIILPPWWKTLFFRITVALFIIGLSLGFYFYRINRLEKQKLYLESLVNERTREVEEKNSRLLQQTIELNDINFLLLKNQQRIETQAEELKANSDNLKTANDQLIEKQELILKQAEDLNESNQKLIILNATKDKFISIIAHDLKNPFNSILGFSELLITKFDKITDDKKYKYLKLIYDSSLKIYRLLENLLQWARTQTGTIQYNPEILCLNNIIATNYEFFRNSLEEKNIEFINNLPDNTNIFADFIMIDTVIRNLLGNAIKFTEKGKITFDARKKNKYWEISIVDTGIGIPEEKLIAIFDIDKAKSTGGTRGEVGSGLGLLICKEFIQKNGGELFVNSTMGIGSTFTFNIPLNNS